MIFQQVSIESLELRKLLLHFLVFGLNTLVLLEQLIEVLGFGVVLSELPILDLHSLLENGGCPLVVL